MLENWEVCAQSLRKRDDRILVWGKDGFQDLKKSIGNVWTGLGLGWMKGDVFFCERGR